MKFPNPIQLDELAELLKCEFLGDEKVVATGMNEIHQVEVGDVSFVDHPKYYDKCLSSEATVVIINKKVDVPEGKGLIYSEDPFNTFNVLGQHFKSKTVQSELICNTANIGEGSVVYPGASIGSNVEIGNNCIIGPNASILEGVKIGNNVVIQAGSVIGGDAFYYKNRETSLDRLKSIGDVVIEDDVEIGTNCSIDRGVSGTTRIGKGSKFDNLVQVGHDTIIGECCIFAAHVGIAGCVKIGNNVTLWGQVGVVSDVVIEDNVTVYGQSGVGNNLEAGKTYLGSPAKEAKTKWKELAYLARLPEIFNNLKK